MPFGDGAGVDEAYKAFVVVHWFRRDLRLHDNPSLLGALYYAKELRCIYILDIESAACSNVGINKWRFLLESLEDLDANLRKLGSQLYVVRGQPAQMLPKLIAEWHVDVLSFEKDPEPYARMRDTAMSNLAARESVQVLSLHGRTLHPPERYTAQNGGTLPTTFREFQRAFKKLGAPVAPVDSITRELIGESVTPVCGGGRELEAQFQVPSLDELGLPAEEEAVAVWKGGETEALRRLNHHLERRAWVACFDMPRMSAQSLMASPGVLSPYLTFGCLSPRLVFSRLSELFSKVTRSDDPPMSLFGQLLLREFFYVVSTRNKNFITAKGNPVCLPIPWDAKDDKKFALWSEGNTGFPWIDAIMRQLRQEGWIHPLARYAVVCFLTRGDLFMSWEHGQEVFNRFLIDVDWSTNAGFWLLLSRCAFGLQPITSYCPVKFGRTVDPTGNFVRKYLPVLKAFPAKYVHEPWMAPRELQERAGCIVGVDYPEPMLNHAEASSANMERIRSFFDSYFCHSTGLGATVESQDVLVG